MAEEDFSKRMEKYYLNGFATGFFVGIVFMTIAAYLIMLWLETV